MSAGLDGARDADGPGDPGAQRYEEEPVGALARADPALGEPAGAHIVAERDGDATEPLAEQDPHGYVAPAQVRGIDRDPVLGVDDAGHGDTGRDGALAEVLLAVRPQVRGEGEDRLHDGVGTALSAGRPPRLVQQGAVGPDQCGLHSGAAHIEGDDVFHGKQFRPRSEKGLVHY